MPKEFWRTYTQKQAGQVMSGLQLLLEQKVLDKEEQEVAKTIQRKLSYRAVKEEGTAVPFNEEENELLNQLEVVLWR